MTTTTKPWNKLRLNYSVAKEILRTLDVDDDRRVLVIGDGSNGAYEWAIEESGLVTKHSDCGYGISDIALRDGLIAYFGLPPVDGYFMKQIAPKAEPAVTPSESERSVDHQNIADHLASRDPSTQCPLCGQRGVHQHSAEEIVIYRNGVKYGRSLIGEMSQPRPSMQEIAAMIDDGRIGGRPKG